MATKRKAKTQKPDPAKLDLLAAAQFNTRKAVLAFVASEKYQTLADLVSCGCDPGELELPPTLAKLAREAGAFLSDDLATLARLAAQSDEGSFLAPVASLGFDFSKRATWLGALAVAFDIGDATHAEEAAGVIVAQLEAITDEEHEAWGRRPPSGWAL